MVNIEFTFIVGMVSIIILLIVRLVNLKKQFFEPAHTARTLGYLILVYPITLFVLEMFRLSFLILLDKIKIEDITSNKYYFFFALLILGISGILVYISLLKNSTKD